MPRHSSPCKLSRTQKWLVHDQRFSQFLCIFTPQPSICTNDPDIDFITVSSQIYLQIPPINREISNTFTPTFSSSKFFLQKKKKFSSPFLRDFQAPSAPTLGILKYKVALIYSSPGVPGSQVSFRGGPFFHVFFWCIGKSSSTDISNTSHPHNIKIDILDQNSPHPRKNSFTRILPKLPKTSKFNCFFDPKKYAP